MKSVAIVLVTMVTSVFLTMRFGSTIARIFGISPMEGGHGYFTLCCAVPVVAPLSLCAGILIASRVNKR